MNIQSNHRNSSKYLNALLVQNNPKLLCKKQNIQQCRKLLNDPKKWVGVDSPNDLKSLDIICFPEMAFTGYNFQHSAHILPMASFVNSGQDFQFAKQVAKQLNSYVVFGYVQKVLIQKIEAPKQNQSQQQTYHLYNSAAVLNRSGQLILNTRKTHLYFCDELWSQQGDNFKTFSLRNVSGQQIKCTVGICMDINQKHFKSGKYQLAQFIKQTSSECLIFISNWTDQSPTTNSREELFDMLNYWLYRLTPLLQQDQPQRLFLIADRVGEEYSFYDKKNTKFFGCSGGLNLQPPEVYDILDKKQEACIFIKGEITF